MLFPTNCTQAHLSIIDGEAVCPFEWNRDHVPGCILLCHLTLSSFFVSTTPHKFELMKNAFMRDIDKKLLYLMQGYVCHPASTSFFRLDDNNGNLFSNGQNHIQLFQPVLCVIRIYVWILEFTVTFHCEMGTSNNNNNNNFFNNVKWWACWHLNKIWTFKRKEYNLQV